MTRIIELEPKSRGERGPGLGILLTVFSILAAFGITLAALEAVGPGRASAPFVPVQQHGDDCLAASSVTFLRYYGVHVSQITFASEDPGASVGHAGVLINGYLRGSGIRVTPLGAMSTSSLEWVIRKSGGPVLATLWTTALPWWKGYYPGAHEIFIERVTSAGLVVWDPAFGKWHTVSAQAVAGSAWEYLVGG